MCTHVIHTHGVIGIRKENIQKEINEDKIILHFESKVKLLNYVVRSHGAGGGGGGIDKAMSVSALMARQSGARAG